MSLFALGNFKPGFGSELVYNIGVSDKLSHRLYYTKLITVPLKTTIMQRRK